MRVREASGTTLDALGAPWHPRSAPAPDFGRPSGPQEPLWEPNSVQNLFFLEKKNEISKTKCNGPFFNKFEGDVRPILPSGRCMVLGFLIGPAQRIASHDVVNGRLFIRGRRQWPQAK